MRIARIEINNYKSFLASGPIDFAPGFNVIVGKNDAGKTALIEALSLRNINKPHMSLKTSPGRGVVANIGSRTRVTFEMDAEEWRQYLSRTPSISMKVAHGRAEHVAGGRDQAKRNPRHGEPGVG